MSRWFCTSRLFANSARLAHTSCQGLNTATNLILDRLYNLSRPWHQACGWILNRARCVIISKFLLMLRTLIPNSLLIKLYEISRWTGSYLIWWCLNRFFIDQWLLKLDLSFLIGSLKCGIFHRFCRLLINHRTNLFHCAFFQRLTSWLTYSWRLVSGGFFPSTFLWCLNRTRWRVNFTNNRSCTVEFWPQF